MLTISYRTGPAVVSDVQNWNLSITYLLCVLDTRDQVAIDKHYDGQLRQGREHLLGTQNSCTHIELDGSITCNATVEYLSLTPDPGLWNVPVECYVRTIAKWPTINVNGRIFTYLTPGEDCDLFRCTYNARYGYTWQRNHYRYIDEQVDSQGKKHWRFLCEAAEAYAQADIDSKPVWKPYVPSWSLYFVETTHLDPRTDMDSASWFKALDGYLKSNVFWDDLRWRVMRYPSVKPGALVASLLKDLKSLDINTITAVQGLTTLARDIKDLVAAAEGHVNPKWLVSTYLYMKYGFENSVRDTVDITRYMLREVNALYKKRARWQVSHATDGVTFTPRDGRNWLSFSEGHCLTTVTAYVDTLDSTLAHATRTMMDTDVFPELGNIWDIIPFSFVVDWFLPIQEIVDAVDANTYRALLKVGACLTTLSYTMSDVDVSRFLPVGPNAKCNVDVRYYQRTVAASIPNPEPELRLPTTFNQWLPAGALIAQGVMNHH